MVNGPTARYSASAACARVLLEQLVAQAVREVVVCPGSRSAPLALAAHAADAAGHLRLHVRTDERSAGFVALGLAKASGSPAAIITTSGTAVGNLLPAVMEASHAGVGLIVLSADRPAALVGFGANQTTDQVGIFGGFTRPTVRVTSAADAATWAAQAARAAVAAADGPVHLNVELEMPLVGDPGPTPPTRALARSVSAQAAVVTLTDAVPTVIVAGDGDAQTGLAAARLAAEARLPLIAEPSSNARVEGALAAGRLVLATGLADEVRRVVIFGHPTLSRPVTRLLGRDDVDVIAVGTERWSDPGHRVRYVVPALRLAAGDESWLRRWVKADAEALARIEQVLAGRPLNGWTLAREVWTAASDGVLMLGASQLTRDADLAPISARQPLVFANRGLAGIDGTLATAIGVGLALGKPTWALVGDLTFLHDANALAIGRAEPRPDLRIVVGDDSGGAIFATLEYGDAAFAGPFERMFGTDPGVDVAALAASYGVEVTTVETHDELRQALGRPVRGIDVVVVRLERSARRALSEAINGA